MNNKTTIDSREIEKFAKLSSNWWDKDGALKTLHDINPARLSFINQSIDLSGKRVLDVGCGGGILSESLAEKGAVVTGIDAENEAINTATAHAKESKLAITYICTPIEDFEELPFDVVTCMELLEHVTTPQTVISHCARLLKPGGYLLVSTINRTLKAYGAAIIAAEYILGLLPKQTHDYDKFLKPSELAGMARNAGLEMTGMRGMAYNPLTRAAELQNSVSVNYLMSFFKP
jgi:2-polyprenyl-6-hydroxyphenyl methylase/3-demethylubiquinone-9 3-methyltransferase